MSTFSLLGILGGVCSLLGYFPYAKRVVSGKESPEQATWLIWTLSNALIFLSYFVLGARTTIWVPLAYLVGSLLITILSFIYGKHGWGLLEKVALVVAILTSVRWIYFDRPLLALVLNVAIGLPAYTRIIRELTLDRTSRQDLMGWSFYFIGAVLNLFAVREWSPVIATLPVLLVIMNGLVLIFAARNKFFAIASAIPNEESVDSNK
jgi:hypothetical protein